MPFLNARVDDDTKQAWRALAKALGRSESELLKQAVQAVLKANPGEGGRANEPNEAPVRDGSIRLPLKGHELEAIERAARLLGWRRNRWLVNLIRTHLLREPRPTDQELAVLHRSSAELLAVGRNLNQIARAMHRDDRYKESVTVERLDELRRVITEHMGRTQDLLEEMENRWAPTTQEDDKP